MSPSSVIKKKKAKKLTPSSLFETINCPLCGSKKFTVVYPGQFPEDLSEEFLKEVYRSSSDASLFEQVVRCDNCNLVYLNPRLKSDLIVGSYAEGEDAAHVAQDEMRVRTFEKALKNLATKYQIKLSKKTKILDIGCAGGAFLRAARNLGLSTIGIEPNKWMSEYARQKYKLDVRPGVLADHKFAANSFDVVTLWDVIEHVPAPNSEFKAIERILKPGGILVINYPDHVSLPARLLGRKWPFWLSVHLQYYTPETIRRQLEDHGFEVLSIQPHWQTLEFGYVLKRIIPYFGLAKQLKVLAEKMGLGHLPMTYWVGQTRVVARKNG